MTRVLEIRTCPGYRARVPRVKPSIEAPIHDSVDSSRDLMVEVGAAVAEAPVAYEASVNIPIYPVYAGQGGVLHHLPINIRALVEISWRVIFC